MPATSLRHSDPRSKQHDVLRTTWYSILDIPVAITSNAIEAIQPIDDTYAAFRCAPSVVDATIAVQLQLLIHGSRHLVSDSHGNQRCWSEQDAAVLDLMDRLVHMLLARLQSRGIYTIHAAAAVHRHRALILAGRSGHGKTTLVLGLLQRGLRLLSDELAVIEPVTRQILPYRRSLHIRPDTPMLIPELRCLEQLPRHQLDDDVEWALTPQNLEQVLPGCLGSAAPLRYVLLLEGTPGASDCPQITPVPRAVAALELLRSTWAASENFEGALSHISQLLDHVTCARLQVGTLKVTLDHVMAWLEASRG